MERMYQRSKIQDESLYYETKKFNGELPVIGVNTFLGESDEDKDNDQESDQGSQEIQLIRSTSEEKETQLSNLSEFHKQHSGTATEAIQRLKDVARNDGNIFTELMNTVRVASLGQISQALYEVGGQYRRSV
jgi:methylmalonyl-CoA mutase